MIDLHDKHILVVEDDDMSFIYINQILKFTQCKISRVKTGIDALEFFHTQSKPDLILLDVQLPDMNGEKAVLHIRNSNGDIPIIAQTASQLGSEKDRLMNAGCSDFITKPYAVDHLLELIGKHIGE
jgi:CheY-like chemotaxis protein